MPTTPFGELTRRERQILEILFAEREASVGDVLAQMPDPPSYSSVRTILRILGEKGHVVHRADGNRYLYRAVVPREAARRRVLRQMVDTFFDGSTSAAVVALLRMGDTQLSDEARSRLEEEVRRAREEGR